MNTNCHPYQPAALFNRPGRAIQDTEWVKDPTDPTMTKGGQIRRGEKVWFHQEQFGSGPAWQPVLLADQTRAYVHPSHFEDVTDGKKS
ncbi:hypothetical protein ACO2Q8_25575 [Larkinella sp. VNQ87]|uniref:hypothetical protein n=1 Tax=Larkinella sp. VNQ87 TaxID=3400921 RepID=UPI003C047E21